MGHRKDDEKKIKWLVRQRRLTLSDAELKQGCGDEGQGKKKCDEEVMWECDGLWVMVMFTVGVVSSPLTLYSTNRPFPPSFIFSFIHVVAFKLISCLSHLVTLPAVADNLFTSLKKHRGPSRVWKSESEREKHLPVYFTICALLTVTGLSLMRQRLVRTECTLTWSWNSMSWSKGQWGWDLLWKKGTKRIHVSFCWLVWLMRLFLTRVKNKGVN